MWLCNSKVDVHVNVRQISPVKWWLILKGYKKLRCFELSSRGDSWKLTFPDTNSSTSGMFKLYFHFGVTKIYKIKISSHERMNRAEMTSIFYWSFCQNYLFWDRWVGFRLPRYLLVLPIPVVYTPVWNHFNSPFLTNCPCINSHLIDDFQTWILYDL